MNHPHGHIQDGLGRRFAFSNEMVAAKDQERENQGTFTRNDVFSIAHEFPAPAILCSNTIYLRVK